MEKIIEKISLFIADYATEYMVIILGLIGIGLLLLSLFLPKETKMYQIDLKRIINKEKNNNMSKTVRYFHSLSRTGIFRSFILDDKSEKYKKYEERITEAGGLNGCTPDIIYLFKWMLLFSGVCVSTFISIINFATSLTNNPLAMILYTVIISLFGFICPDLFLKMKIKERKTNFIEELEVIELFITIYLKAGYNVYDLLVALRDVTIYSKIYISECINEFYIDQEKALQNFANKTKIEEYQLIVDILKQAIKVSGQNMVEFVENHSKQLKRIKNSTVQEKYKKKPLQYAFILALPLIGVIILWFYPLALDALDVFTQMGNL